MRPAAPVPTALQLAVDRGHMNATASAGTWEHHRPQRVRKGTHTGHLQLLLGAAGSKGRSGCFCLFSSKSPSTCIGGDLGRPLPTVGYCPDSRAFDRPCPLRPARPHPRGGQEFLPEAHLLLPSPPQSLLPPPRRGWEFRGGGGSWCPRTGPVRKAPEGSGCGTRAGSRVVSCGPVAAESPGEEPGQEKDGHCPRC